MCHYGLRRAIAATEVAVTDIVLFMVFSNTYGYPFPLRFRERIVEVVGCRLS
jgi:hypothetical protein